jgi:hypothetical protein
MRSEVRKAQRALERDLAINGLEKAAAREKYEATLRTIAERFDRDMTSMLDKGLR